MIRVPLPDSEHVKNFCSSITPAVVPVTVQCQPAHNKPEKECFPIVEERIALEGGREVLGWALWEWPGVFIEAEFHAVWSPPSGGLIDITPRGLAAPNILFLPDPTRKYEGRQVANIRKQLVKDNDVTRYLFTFHRIFEILNAGDRAFQHAVELPSKALKELNAVQKEGAQLERRLQKRYPN